MDQIRNFGNQNKSLIVNGIYIVAVAIIVYYLFQFYLGTSSGLSLEGDKQSAVSLASGKAYVIHNGVDQSTRDRRIKLNGRYTFCTWFYLNENPATQTTLLTLNEQDQGTGGSARQLLSVGLYPGTNKMFIRSRTGPGAGAIGVGGIGADTVALPMCDVVDVDYQRWIQLTVVVNGRIMDVYMDGKLARSCVLSAGQQASIDGKTVQSALVYKFPGFYSGLYFMSDADTPDSIYARYQMGPYTKGSFLNQLWDKLGVKVTYTGAGGVRQTVQKSDWFE